MLYNPKWKRDVNSLSGLIDWLGSKNPEEEYNHYSGKNCLCAQYYRDSGYWFVSMGMNYFMHGLFNRTMLLPSFNAVAQDKPHTFGAALQRARKLNGTRS